VVSKPVGAFGFCGRRKDESPDSLRSSTGGMVIPPAGPNVADLSEDNMWGEEVECFRARLCNMGGKEGDWGTSSVVDALIRSEVLVFRLSWLGLRFMAGMAGLMNTGDEGSDTSDGDCDGANGGCMERPFMLRGRRGEGDVTGRSNCGSDTERIDSGGNGPKVGPGKDDKGTRLMGESGDEDGDGSEKEAVSVPYPAVVGDESADSEFCVDVLS
jgi:hypothetical protein